MIKDLSIGGAVDKGRARIVARILDLRAKGLEPVEIAGRERLTVRFVRSVLANASGEGPSTVKPTISPTVKRRRVNQVRRPPKLISQAERSLDFLAGVRWVLASLDYHKDLGSLGAFLGDWLALPRKDQEAMCLFCGGRRSADLTNQADLRLARPQWLWLSDRGVPVEKIAELIGARTMTVITGVVNEEHRRNVRRGMEAAQARRRAEDEQPSRSMGG